MAVIPGAQGLGEAIARPQRLNETQVPRAAFGSQIADSLAQYGANRLNEEARATAQADAEAQAARKAADKAQALASMQLAADDLTSLGDTFASDIKSGKIDKTKAGEEWMRQARELTAEAVKDVPASHIADVQRDLEHRIRRGASGVQTSVRLRDQHDVRSGIFQTVKSASRLFRTDPAAADSMVSGVLEALGPHSGLEPDQIVGIGQDYRESSRFTAGFEAVSAGRHDLKALSAAEAMIGKDDVIGPQKRAQLLDRAADYRFRIEEKQDQARRRQLAEADHRLNVASTMMESARHQALNGTLDEAFGEQVRNAIAGTPLATEFRGLLDAQREFGSFVARPIAEQRATVEALQTRYAKEASPALEKTLKQYQSALSSSEHAVNEGEGLKAWATRTGEQIQPLDMRGGLLGLPAQLQQRVQASARASEWTGKPESPLFANEAQAVRGMIDVLPAKEQSQAIAALASAIGPQATLGLGAQIGKGASDEQTKALGMQLRYGAAATTEGRFVSELIGKGARALKDKTIKEEKTPVDGWTGQINKQLDGLYLNQKQAEETAQAARLILAGLVSEGANGSSSNVTQAVSLAMGGFVRETKGGRTIVPAGMEISDVTRRLASMTADEVKAQAPGGKLFAAGAPMTTDQFLKALPEAQLQYVGRGKYLVKAGSSGFVTDERLKPIVVEVPYGSR